MAQDGMTAPLADRIRAVLALADHRTPGNWRTRYTHRDKSEGLLIAATAPGHQIVSDHAGGSYPTDDAAFIASAPEMAALLRECLADDGWRPISEAPTDGTLVILYCTAEDGSKLQTIGWWEAKFDKDGYDDIKDDYNYRGAWTDHGVQSWAYQEYAELSPTHWRPLPAAPGAKL